MHCQRRIVRSAAKVIATVFCDYQGERFIDYLEMGETIINAHYTLLLDRLVRHGTVRALQGFKVRICRSSGLLQLNAGKTVTSDGGLDTLKQKELCWHQGGWSSVAKLSLARTPRTRRAVQLRAGF